MLRQSDRIRASLLAAYSALLAVSLFDFGQLSVAGTEVPLFLLLLPPTAVAAFFGKSRPQGRLEWMREAASLFALAAFLLLSLTVCGDFASTLTVVGKLVIYFSLFLFIGVLTDKKSLLELMLHVYTAGAAVAVLIAFYYYFFQPLHPLRLTVARGLSPNLFGIMLTLPLLFVTAQLLTARSVLRFLGFLALAGLFSSALALTFSRGTWVAVFAGACFLVVLLGRKIRPASLLVLALAVLACLPILFLSEIQSRIETLWSLTDPAGSESIRQRIILLSHHWQRLSESPWLGSGFKSQEVVPQLGVARSAHNSFLTIWAGAGIGAFLAFLAFIFLHLSALLSIRRQNWLGKGVLPEVFAAAFACLLFELMVGDFVLGFPFWGLMGFQSAAVACAVRRAPRAGQHRLQRA